jgi:hypothetical protein
VQFEKRFWDGLANGSVTVAVRRWKRPSVKAGSTLKSPGGLLAIDEVARVELDDVTEADAIASGFTRRDELLAALRPEGDLYRVRFHRVGDDPRIALRNSSDIDDEEMAALKRRLGRVDWGTPILRLIGENPGVVSTELAPRVGMERFPFKQRVRRLKELGLTESLPVGYRLSPRGEALLQHLD